MCDMIFRFKLSCSHLNQHWDVSAGAQRQELNNRPVVPHRWPVVYLTGVRVRVHPRPRPDDP